MRNKLALIFLAIPLLAIGAASVTKVVKQNAVSFAGQTNRLSMDTNGNLTIDGTSGISTSWTNIIDGVITQRITTVKGIVTANTTL